MLQTVYLNSGGAAIRHGWFFAVAEATVGAAFESLDMLALDVEAAFRSAESEVLRTLFGITPGDALWKPGDPVFIHIDVLYGVRKEP